ncbi:MAG: DAK2 domain-containing protein [Anaerolineae bacterium]|nr:DAK2 domain-containing protein [Anaerolineae bacterium]
MAKTSIDGQALKILLGAGVKAVAPYVELINELNVFPVPDGDTGINLFHTLNRAWAEVENSADTRAYAVVERFAYGALMGARGNSGTIMSQLLAGFARTAAGGGFAIGGETRLRRRLSAGGGNCADRGARGGGEPA